MIVWLNGTFGVGKTTTSEQLAGTGQDWRVFDPEQVGYMLLSGLRDVDVDDFQDLRPWRTLVPRVLREVQDFTEANLVAPQTVLSAKYWTELSGGFADEGLDVFHVVLDCDHNALRRRIIDDQVEVDAQQWRLGHLDRYEAEQAWLVESADLVVDTTTATPEQATATILAAVADRRSR